MMILTVDRGTASPALWVSIGTYESDQPPQQLHQLNTNKTKKHYLAH